MPNLPNDILTVLSIFSPLFSNPSYANFLLLFSGHVLCKGRRTITEILKIHGLKDVKNYSKFHDFFRVAKWSPLNGTRILLMKLVTLIPGEIFITIDSTIERRKGPKIKGLGIQRDPVRSTKSRKAFAPGLHWLVCAIHVQFPWSKRSWALPFLTVKMPPKHVLSTSKNQADLNKKKKHKTMTEWTCQIVILLHRWIGPSRKIIIVADSAFATYKLANTCKDFGITLLSRMRLDARLFSFPKPNKKGRKRLVGDRLPTFKEMSKDPFLKWETLKVAWYNNTETQIETLTGKCLWYGYGIRPVPIKWVLTRKSKDDNEPVALFCTDVDGDPIGMIEAFVGRWKIEVTFAEARRHLGMETQRQWSDNSIERVTPCLLASFSVISLIASECLKSPGEEISIQTTSWYRKKNATFSDILAYTRRKILRKKYFFRFGKNDEMGKEGLEEIIELLMAA